MENEAVNWLTQLGGYAPWIMGGIAAVAITQFLLGLGKWEIQVPWQVRAYTRVLVMIIFVYLISYAGVLILPESSDKIPAVTAGVNLVGDLLKTIIGAVIGALSMSMKDATKEPENTPPPTP